VNWGQVITAAIVALCIVAAVVLDLAHDTVPTFIEGVAAAALGGHLTAWQIGKTP
jgi:hypothetical protein